MQKNFSIASKNFFTKLKKRGKKQLTKRKKDIILNKHFECVGDTFHREYNDKYTVSVCG